MSDLVKTEIEIIDSYAKWKEFYERNEMPKDIEEAVYKKAETKWLVLPSGIDTLEMMLKKEVLLGVEVVKIISSVFARITCFLCVGVVADGEIINV